LGESVEYTPIAGAPITIDAIFIAEPFNIVLGDQAGTDDVRKELHLRASDVPSPREGDTATIAGVTYRVVPPIQPDGKGMISVALEAQ
jgi:hypothetical protein